VKPSIAGASLRIARYRNSNPTERKAGGDVVNWVQCSRFDEERTPVWINLDQVVAIQEHSNGSTLFCPMQDKDSTMELVVWDRPLDILARKAGGDF
jgi:hypothetical protein